MKYNFQIGQVVSEKNSDENVDRMLKRDFKSRSINGIHLLNSLMI